MLKTNTISNKIDVPILVDSVEGKHIELSKEQIINMLPLYKPDCIFIESALFSDGKLHCSCIAFEYQYSKRKVKHLTREHSLLYVTQAAYLLVGMLPLVDSNWPVSSKEMLTKMLNEQMTFTKVEINFDKFIINAGVIHLNIWNSKYKIIDNNIYGSLHFEIEDKCYGLCNGIISLDNSFKLE